MLYLAGWTVWDVAPKGAILTQWEQCLNFVISLKTFLKSYRWNLFQLFFPGVALWLSIVTFHQSMGTPRCLPDWIFRFDPFDVCNLQHPWIPYSCPIDSVIWKSSKWYSQSHNSLIGVADGLLYTERVRKKILLASFSRGNPVQELYIALPNTSPCARKLSLWGTVG